MVSATEIITDVGWSLPDEVAFDHPCAWIKILIAAIFVATAWPAYATDEVRCSGVWFHQGDRDRVGQCFITLESNAYLHVGEYCDAHGHCAFVGHVARQVGKNFDIDKITGKITETTNRVAGDRQR